LSAADGRTQRRRPAWWGSDFVLKDGRVLIPDAGGDIPLDSQLLRDVARWLTYYALVRLKSALNALMAPPGPRIWFTPARPRPWYIVWSATVWAGLRFARRPEEAQAAIYFDDRTKGHAPKLDAPKTLNFRCTDVSKSHVAATFEQVFGYPLAIDPTTHVGVAVEKSEENGKHDGRLIECPMQPRPGHVYQRFIDTAVDGAARDLRTPCVGGRPVIVMIKLKPPRESFSIQNARVFAVEADTVFSHEEKALIGQFADAMGMDWGSLDVLRETSSGRLYIVDANKTDTGPPVVLSWRDRVRVTSALAKALRDLVEA